VRVTVRVPATSANLGPGFDCFGLALDLCNEVIVDTEAEPGVTWEGEGADELPTDGSDMVSRAMRIVAGDRRRPLPPLKLAGMNRIPLERGLGSSAAACVAGIALANGVLDAHLSLDDMVQFAVKIEGHPDNATAAVHGGLTIALAGGAAIRLDPNPQLRPVLLIPPIRSSTSAARTSLPDVVSRSDAVDNIGHAAVGLVALTSRPELLPLGLEDRLHQDQRLERVPEVREVFDDIRGRVGLPVCLSGAGPSLLAFERNGDEIGNLPDGWRAIRPGVNTTGFEIDVES
jgi:homoserine kinase